MTDAAFDLIVIGAGPAGYVGAIRAAQLGLRTALVERAEPGGVCLNWGCIPTKSLLHTADLLRSVRSAARFGVKVGAVEVDLAAAVAQSRAAAQRLSQGVRSLLRRHKVTLVSGEGRLDGPGRVHVQRADATSQVLAARDVLLATGARSRSLPGFEGIDAARLWGPREAMTPSHVPQSLMVIGAGAIGMEFASFYRALGAQVTVVEARDEVLPGEDHEVGAFVRAAFEADGVRVLTGCTVAEVGNHGGGVRALVRRAGVDLDGGRDVGRGPSGMPGRDPGGEQGREASIVVDADRVLVSVGVTGNVEHLGLERTAVGVERGFIVCDPFGATAQPGVHAAGDVAGPPWLAHAASHQAVACVERIAGVKGAHAPRVDRIPGAIFCVPQVASVGLTERAARAAGHELRVGRFPFAANGRAVAAGIGDGFVKTVFDAWSGELLGAHMVGEGVTELIHGFSLARTLEAAEEDLMQAVFPHPTLSESMHEAVLAAYGRALHV